MRREIWSVLGTLRTRRATLFWILCGLTDTVDSQTGESYSSDSVKEQKQRQESVRICGQTMTDESKAAEFKTN